MSIRNAEVAYVPVGKFSDGIRVPPISSARMTPRPSAATLHKAQAAVRGYISITCLPSRRWAKVAVMSATPTRGLHEKFLLNMTNLNACAMPTIRGITCDCVDL